MQQTDKIKKMVLASVEMLLKDRRHEFGKLPVSKIKNDHEHSGYTILMDYLPAVTVGERRLPDHSIKDYFIEMEGRYFYYDVDEFRDVRKNLVSIQEVSTHNIGYKIWLRLGGAKKWNYDGK